MGDSGLSTFDLGELLAGAQVEVALQTAAHVRLISEGEGATALQLPAVLPHLTARRPYRRFEVPRAGRWHLLVEHAHPTRRSGCHIRLTDPIVQ